MTRNYYTTPSNYADHTRFGGNVYNYDFDGYTPMSVIADRIISDRKFDDKCRKLEENNKRTKSKEN